MRRGDAKGNLNGVGLFAPDVMNLSFHCECKTDMRKSDMVIQTVGDSDLTAGDSAMAFLRRFAKVWHPFSSAQLIPVTDIFQ